MGIYINKTANIQANKRIDQFVLSDYFKNDINHSRVNGNNNINSQIRITTKSDLNKRMESHQIIDYSFNLIQQVCAAVKIENKVNGALYQSIGINKLSECKTEDEQRYLYNQNKVIINWSSNFADYYNKRKIMKEKVEDEKISQIGQVKDLSAISNELVTEINNNISPNINTNVNENYFSNTHHNNKTPLKPKMIHINNTENNNTRNNPKGIQPKHCHVQSTNLSYNAIKSNHIRIDLQSLMNLNSPVKALNNIHMSPVCTEYNMRMKSEKCSKNNRKVINQRIPIIKMSCATLKLVNLGAFSEKNRLDNCSNISHSTINDGLYKELLEDNSKQQKKIDPSPLHENRHIRNIEDMKRVLNEYKNRNLFLFSNK